MTASLEKRVADELSRGGRVLATRLLYLGDTLLTLPAVGAIRRHYPNARIDYAARGAGAEILRGEPVFDRVFRIPDREEGTLAMLKVLRQLRRRRYTVAIDFFSNPRSALMVWLTGARMRIGGDRRGRRHLYTHAITTPPDIRRASDHHLHYLHPLGIGVDGESSKPTLTISNSEREAAARVLRSFGVDTGRHVIGVHPGGKWEVKRWPVARFAELIERLAGRRVASGAPQLVVLIGPGEERYQTALRDLTGDRAVFLPTLPIRETAAVIEALNGLVVCDGGIMHVGVAVGTPTVGIFGSAEPDIWFPYEAYGPFAPAYVDIECRPCHRHACDHLSCLNGLTAEAVEAKLFDVMGR